MRSQALMARRRSPRSTSRLDAKGARIFRDVTRKSMHAVILFRNEGEVVTAPDPFEGSAGGCRFRGG